MNEKLYNCMRLNVNLVDSLHSLIQSLQDIDPHLAFFAIEAQRNLMQGNALMKGKDLCLQVNELVMSE